MFSTELGMSPESRYEWITRAPLHLIDTVHGGTMLSGSARAETPFGPLAGRTAVHVTDQGDDSAVISFNVGGTPVMLAVAGANYIRLIELLIEHASEHNRARFEAALDAALEEGAA